MVGISSDHECASPAPIGKKTSQSTVFINLICKFAQFLINKKS